MLLLRSREKSISGLNNDVMSSASGCTSGVDRRKAICSLLCSLLVGRLSAAGKVVNLFW